MTRVDLGNRLPFSAGVYFGDQDYALPACNWLLNEFSPWFVGYCKGEGLEYASTWDCDDFASMFRIKVVEAHFRNGRNPNEGVAVAEVWYTRDEGVGHAINLAVVDGGVPCFIEPQIGKKLELTDAEKRSVYFARF
jgi:hypothetical protein